MNSSPKTKKQKILNVLTFCFNNAINNYKLKHKMLLIYVFCVVIPVIATNCIVIGIVVNAENRKTEKNLDNVVSAVEYEITSTIDEAVSIAKSIYAKKSLCTFLETEFSSPLEYYKAYIKIDFLPILEYGNKSEISDIKVYSNNNTILEGTSFFRIESIENTEWYQSFKSNNQDMSICMYYDNKKFFGTSCRNISIIRRLKNYSANQFDEKFVKIDIDYDKQQSDIINQNHYADVYVICGGKILFANNAEEKTYLDFNDFDGNVLSLGKNFSQKDFSLYKTDFKIVAISHEADIIDILHRYLWALPLLLFFNLILPIIVIFGVNKSICVRIRTLGEYLKKMKQKQFEKMPESESKDEIAELIHGYNIMTEEMDNLIQVSYREQIENRNLLVAKQQAELLALYSQINPHFMFNALESIRMRSVIKNETETADIINKLAVLMRSSISWKNDTVTIKDELQFSEAYLELQKYRFGDQLSYTISIDEDCNDFMLPKLSLVTFVENACVHGIEGMKSGGMIFISVTHKDDRMRIEIEDTGIGMDEEKAEKIRNMLNTADTNMLDEAGSTKKSIGMLNACIRLKMYFKNDIDFELDTEQCGGTLITITVPYNFSNA